MRVGLLLVLVLGCGGSPKQPTTPPPTAPANTATPTGRTVAAASDPMKDPRPVCQHMLDLQKQGCKLFEGLPFTDPQVCVDEVKKAGSDPSITAFMTCAANPSCEEITNCLTAARDKLAAQEGDLNGVEGGEIGDEDDAAPTKFRDCKDTASMDPVGIPADQWAKRNGASAKKFGDVKSTKAAPVEMCGIPAENAWLGTLRCDDGSQPIKNVLDAENVRRGNVGAGGKCGSIIDRYQPKCGTKSYDIYIDAYVCPKQ